PALVNEVFDFQPAERVAFRDFTHALDSLPSLLHRRLFFHGDKLRDRRPVASDGEFFSAGYTLKNFREASFGVVRTERICGFHDAGLSTGLRLVYLVHWQSQGEWGQRKLRILCQCTK